MAQSVYKKLNRRIIVDNALAAVMVFVAAALFIGGLDEKETLPESSVSTTAPCLPESTEGIQGGGH